jgi:hypothetical protein
MGVNFDLLPFFDLLHAKQRLCGPMIALGSLEIQETEETIRNFAIANGYRNLMVGKGLRHLFLDRYQIPDYRDCDINGAADLVCDLNKPLDRSLADSAQTVLNGGTIEHVFDVAKALVNMHEMTRIDGTMIHLAPLSFYEHGFYNFNPLFFRSIAEANCYRMIAEAFYEMNADSGGKSGGPANLYITHDGKYNFKLRKGLQAKYRGARIPSKILYMIAFAKSRNEEFVCPYECRVDPVAVRQLISSEGATAELIPPFLKDEGHAWLKALPEFEECADDNGNPMESPVILLEDGMPLRMPHALHSDIRQLGAGRYSHWKSVLIFSSSDNSNPNENGRTYKIIIPES